MAQPDLHKFQNQLSEWIKQELGKTQFPFRHLEKHLVVQTMRGRETADIVLWINRESLIAGSLILCPEREENKTEETGMALAESLGLGHFVIWGAREITIWRTNVDKPERIKTYHLPNAKKLVPEDFRKLLKTLLEQLKIVTVTSAVGSKAFTSYYVLNLCLVAIKDILPLLTAQAKRVAGGDRSDNWVEQTPLELAWKSIWRLLFLIWKDRFPQGVQPERLEQAMYYVLADLLDPALKNLNYRVAEPELGAKGAIRLHHLAVRLQQLRWPHNDLQVADLCALLLRESAKQFGMTTQKPPWAIKNPRILINHHWQDLAEVKVIIAPEAYLNGVALQSIASKSDYQPLLQNDVTSLTKELASSDIFAFLDDQRVPDRRERAARLLRLRQVWPTRRFILERSTPAFFWDCLHLLGLQNHPRELQLQLPERWYYAFGAKQFWSVVTEKYRLVAITKAEQCHFLWLGPPSEELNPIVKFYRDKDVVDISHDRICSEEPGLLAICLSAHADILDLFLQKRLKTLPVKIDSSLPIQLEEGLRLFSQTELGEYLWSICRPETKLPQNNFIHIFHQSGMLVPDQTILDSLIHLARQSGGDQFPKNKLNQELIKFIGPLPKLQARKAPLKIDQTSQMFHTSDMIESIVEKVFIDGRPCFPEHYLLRYYRPELITYEFPGPLHVAEIFFDHILLTDNHQFQIEVAGSMMAEALVLASHSGKLKATLPKDKMLLCEIVAAYRNDLENLWNVLLQVCRQHVSRRHVALRIARRIWQRENLPTPDIFSKST